MLLKPKSLRLAPLACFLALAGCTDESTPGPSATSSGAATTSSGVATETTGGVVPSTGGSADPVNASTGGSLNGVTGTFTTGGVPSGTLDAGSASSGDAGPGPIGTATDASEAADAGDGDGDAAEAGEAAEGGDAAVEASAPHEPVFHVFLLLGQSNMAGYPKAQSSDKVEDPRVRVLGYDDCAETGRREGQWATAVPPLHECWNKAIGPGDYFAKTLLESIPEDDTIGLVPCAISGEKIETFMKAGGAKYSWILERARSALDAGGVIDGMLFHQGESNCGSNAWPEKVRTLVNDLRQDLGLGEVPFLAGELVYSGACSQHNPLVNQLPGLIPNAHVVSAQDLALDPSDRQWRLHFGHDAQVEFGKRYAATMVEALGW